MQKLKITNHRIIMKMNRNFPPNIDANLFSFAAAVCGAVFSGDFNTYELNSIGNWIILVGQYMLTYSAQVQLIENRYDDYNINCNSREFKNGGSPYRNSEKSNQNQRMEVEFLLDAVSRMQKELDEIKNKLNN